MMNSNSTLADGVFSMPDTDTDTDRNGFNSNGAFPLADYYSYSNSYEINKGSTGTNSDDDSYAELLWKLLEFHFIGTDISVKMGAIAIGIRIEIGIEIGIGSVETVLAK